MEVMGRLSPANKRTLRQRGANQRIGFCEEDVGLKCSDDLKRGRERNKYLSAQKVRVRAGPNHKCSESVVNLVHLSVYWDIRRQIKHTFFELEGQHTGSGKKDI